MSAHLENELAWTERPARELVRLSWPIAVSMLSYSTMTVVDTLFVSRIGSAALAGVGLGGATAFLCLCFSFGLLRAVKTLVSQAVGAGRGGEVSSYLGAGIWLALGLGAATLAVGEALAHGLPFVAATPASGAAAKTYVSIRMLGTPTVLVYVALREARYGVGDARSPMRAAVFANLVNIALEWVFVVALGKGVAGAAWATVIAEVAEAAMLVFAQREHGFGLRSATKAHLVAAWRLGLPTGAQFLVEMGSFATLTALVAGFGEVDAAAHQIVIQICTLSFLPAVAVSEAASVLTGQAVGAGRHGLVRVVSRRALALGAGYMGLCSLAFAFGGDLIVSRFAHTAALQETAVSLLAIAAVFQVFDGANIVARGALRGTGDVRFAAWAGILASWCLTPPFAWYLGGRLGMGVRGGWIGMCVEVIVGAVILWWRLEGGGWRAAALGSRERFAKAAGVVAAAPAG
jgi:MATE family multidrug resistance protein